MIIGQGCLMLWVLCVGVVVFCTLSLPCIPCCLFPQVTTLGEDGINAAVAAGPAALAKFMQDDTADVSGGQVTALMTVLEMGCVFWRTYLGYASAVCALQHEEGRRSKTELLGRP